LFPERNLKRRGTGKRGNLAWPKFQGNVQREGYPAAEIDFQGMERGTNRKLEGGKGKVDYPIQTRPKEDLKGVP